MGLDEGLCAALTNMARSKGELLLLPTVCGVLNLCPSKGRVAKCNEGSLPSLRTIDTLSRQVCDMEQCSEGCEML